MTQQQRTKFKVDNADELRDALSNSPVFNMFDCAVEIEAPFESDTTEIDRMVKILEAAINVVDVTVHPEDIRSDLHPNQYLVEITEVPVNFTERNKNKK